MGRVNPPGRLGSAPAHEHRRRGRDAGRGLVLNATFEPLNVGSVRRPAVPPPQDKAEMLEHAAWERRSDHTATPRRVVTRLVPFVKVPRDPPRRKIPRRAVFARDGWACQYCG